MNIAYICAEESLDVFGDEGPGAHVRGCIRGMRTRGHRVTIFFQKDPSLPPKDPIADAVVHVPLPALLDPLRRFRLPMGIRWLKRLPTIRAAQQLVYNSALLASLEREHRRRSFDLIFERHSLWHDAGLRMARSFGIPYFLEVNAPLAQEAAMQSRTFLGPLAKNMELKAWRMADKVFPVSNELAGLMLARGVAPENIKVLPCAVSSFEFDAPGKSELRHRHGLPAEYFLFGFLGAFRPWHGTDLLPDVLRRLREGPRRPHLVLIGDGPMLHPLTDALKSAGLSGYYTWTGRLPHERVPEVLRCLDAAILMNSSPIFSYMSPIKLFEYMAAGLPVVASRLGQHQELITHERTGLLANPGDADDFARQLARIRDNPAWGGAIGNEARTKVLQGHTWEHNVESIERAVGIQDGV